MKNANKIIDNLMLEFGFRRKREVAEYFGVSPQALSIWIAKNQIPAKHLLKLSQESAISRNKSFRIKTSKIRDSDTKKEMKAVIEYLLRENNTLKKQLKKLQKQIDKKRISRSSDRLFDKIISDTLYISGRVSDGVITELDGKWELIMGYKKSQLKGLRFDHSDLIHPDELEKVKKIKERLDNSTAISLTRYSTIQRWKNGSSGEYIMLSMVWDVNIEEDVVLVVCKPIDQFIEGSEEKKLGMMD